MPYSLLPDIFTQLEDLNGNPAVGHTLEFYVYNTSTRALLYTDSAGTALGTSCTLNALGGPQTSGGTACSLFGDTAQTNGYKIIQKDADGATVKTFHGPIFPVLAGASVGDSVYGSTTIAKALDAHRVASMSSLVTGTWTGIDEVCALGFYGGWAASVAGPKGRSYWHHDGTTGGTPTTNSTAAIIAAMATGKVISADGKGWVLSGGQTITQFMFGAVADGGTTNTDNLSAFEAMRDFCDAEGKEIVLQPGDHWFSDTFELNGVPMTSSAALDVYQRSVVLRRDTATNGATGAVIKLNRRTYPGRVARVSRFAVRGGEFGVDCGDLNYSKVSDLFVHDTPIGMMINYDTSHQSDFNIFENIICQNDGGDTETMKIGCVVSPSSVLFNNNHFINCYWYCSEVAFVCLAGNAVNNKFELCDFGAKIGFMGNLGLQTEFDRPYFEATVHQIHVNRGYATIVNPTIAGGFDFTDATYGTGIRAKFVHASVTLPVLLGGTVLSANVCTVEINGGYYPLDPSNYQASAHYIFASASESNMQRCMFMPAPILGNDDGYIAPVPTTMHNRSFVLEQKRGSPRQITMRIGNVHLFTDNSSDNRLNIAPAVTGASGYQINLRAADNNVILAIEGDAIIVKNTSGVFLAQFNCATNNISVNGALLPASSGAASTNQLWRDSGTGAIYVK